MSWLLQLGDYMEEGKAEDIVVVYSEEKIKALREGERGGGRHCGSGRRIRQRFRKAYPSLSHGVLPGYTSGKVDYHTGVHLTTPLAILATVSKLAKRGILVKSSSKLELLSKVDTIVMDKTGTLTLGSPKVMDVVGLSLSEEGYLQGEKR